MKKIEIKGKKIPNMRNSQERETQKRTKNHTSTTRRRGVFLQVLQFCVDSFQGHVINVVHIHNQIYLFKHKHTYICINVQVSMHVKILLLLLLMFININIKIISHSMYRVYHTYGMRRITKINNEFDIFLHKNRDNIWLRNSFLNKNKIYLEAIMSI